MEDPGQCNRINSSSSLYDSGLEHDACGVGFIADSYGRESHDIVSRSIEILENLRHRGASAGDGKTGDGAGVLTRIPDGLFRRECAAKDITLPASGLYGIGVAFLPKESALQGKCRAIIERTIEDEELDFIGWREVPVQDSVLGQKAARERPAIAQFIVGWSSPDSQALERKLYIARKQISKRVGDETKNPDALYIPSLSCRTIVYKGLMMGSDVAEFYRDLKAPDFTSAMAVVHQRYSTNTFPSWRLAQPFRYLAHNGEINTLRGNINQMHSREKRLADDLFGSDIRKLIPVIEAGGSDSAALDNALELLTACGRDVAHSMLMLIPQAWGLKYPIGPDLRGFFEYHAGLMEPWDGPAAVAFTDGIRVGALLDRNGLRPARFTICDDGLVILASETGVLDIPSSKVRSKGALRPGQMILVDLERHRILGDGEIKAMYTRRQPYRRWVEENKIELHGLFNAVTAIAPDTATLARRQKLFGYTREELNLVIGHMASTAHEPVGSMGYDSPLAVFSAQPQLLSSYFKQLFAQVTNPPIDPIREELVMSLMTFMGNPPNILKDDPRNCRLIKLRHPILSNDDLDRIKSQNIRHFKSVTIRMEFPAGADALHFERAIEHMCDQVESAATGAKPLIVLTDRLLEKGFAPIPALLAVSAANQRLTRAGTRTSASIIVETGEARDVHQVALLLGYGATAVNPYLAFETVADMAIRKTLETEMTVTKALENYTAALCAGLLKIMSKMGISTMRSYRGAQVFEAVGISSEVVRRYFTGTASRVGGIGLSEISAEAKLRYEAVQQSSQTATALLPSGGAYRFRRDGERHLWTPDTISFLQQATRENNRKIYDKYARLINEQSEAQFTLRGMFKFKPTESVPLEKVEPAENIMRRFVTSAMSFGSISRETHETLAIAMNRIGAMSNCGEGGEDPARYKIGPDGENRCSAVKQVASGRFGVTAEYLANARELQIKIAQGAKPGEGGQLPGHKVNEEIARVRHSTPGVTLLSPPPHHDIYSIEDIKQLIFDLKNANPNARISVKLVSEVGVGTVAAGLAKGKADMILISGGDGGTGASPLSSIRHAGAPWELGLAETQQTLVLNDLRRRVRIQADGQIKTGRDAIIAALLGAEEFGFATTALVICGCVMMRKCNQNTCPVGVATQDPELRKRFTGKPEHVINFFRMLAEDMREHMARLGFTKLDDLVGRADLLDTDHAIGFWKARGMDFSKIIGHAHGSENARRCVASQDHELDNVMDKSLIKEAEDALGRGKRVEIAKTIRNTDRAVGAMLSGQIAMRYGNAGLPDNTIICRLKGSAGQSFGAFGARGLTLLLEGEANDYLGKGLSGGTISVRPPADCAFDASENTICGNVGLYGATSGEVYICGKAGERFAVRNSGANAVVEGVGDHGCEYMTGGRVVILGETGVNFAAGMSGGIAYVYDGKHLFDGRCNLEMVDLELVSEPADLVELRGMIEKHLAQTGSGRAADILDNWETTAGMFVKVFPMEYRRAIGRMTKEDEATEREEVVNG